jgi:NAD(P)H-hydrate epimerase
MFAPLPTPEEMARWDRSSVADFGLKPEILMENASRACLAALEDALGNLSGRRAVLFAGPGNNGGDALALARHLACAGAEVRILHSRGLGDYKGESGYQVRLARRLELACERLRADRLPRIMRELRAFAPDMVVDGLLGTGFAGPLRPDFLAYVHAVNALGESAFVLAVDIPSGLSGLSGEPGPEAVRADLTVTFEAAKPGLVQPAARQFVGELDVRAIGIPPQVKALHPAGQRLLTPAVAGLLPLDPPDLHKGTAGSVCVIGGSPGLTGAPHLAALGALRAGAGYAVVACPAALADQIKGGQPDVMIFPAAPGEVLGPDSLARITDALARHDAAVLGPGLGRSLESAAFLASFLTRVSDLPLVLDADALFLLAGLSSIEPDGSTWPKHLVLTPHPGEAATLLGVGLAEVQGNRLDAARRLAERYRAVAVLKGAATVIAAPDEASVVCPLCAPNLAVAGSGDVLSGCLGALLARGLRPFDAACLAVYWHGLAGKILSGTYPGRGNLASEIAFTLPAARKEMCPC